MGADATASRVEVMAGTEKPAIDFQHLRQYTAGDAAVENEVLGVFLQQADIWVRMLQTAGDDKSWVDAAHSLKGSARGVGAWRVAELCERAEALAVRGTPAERSIAIGDLKAAIDEVVQVIENHLEGRAHNSAA